MVDNEIKETNEILNEVPKSLTVVWIILGIIAVSAFIPASWFGVKPQTHTRLNLETLDELSRLSLDENKNNNPDWRDLLSETINSASTSEIDSNIQKILDDPNNLTASFSKNLYTASAYLSKNNITDTQTQQQLITSIISEEGSKIISKEYLISDLKIIKTETPTSVKKYGNDLGTILNKAILYNLGVGDVEIMRAFVVKKDASVLDSLKIKKGRSEEIIQSLLSTPVPLTASIYHLLTINKLSAYATAVENMSKADTDPVRATISFNHYVSTTKSLVLSISNFVEYFKLSKTVFSAKEPGHIFSSGYTNN